MNETVNKFQLTGGKFMPHMHSKQLGFTYSACGLFTKNKEKIKKFRKTGDTRYICRIKLDKACFEHDMVYSDKDLAKRSEYDNALRNKAFKIPSNLKHDGYERGLASMVCKKSAGSSVISIPNQQLADELYKPIIRKFKGYQVYSSFKDNIWGADPASKIEALDFYYVSLIFLANMHGLFL